MSGFRDGKVPLSPIWNIVVDEILDERKRQCYKLLRYIYGIWYPSMVIFCTGRCLLSFCLYYHSFVLVTVDCDFQCNKPFCQIWPHESRNIKPLDIFLYHFPKSKIHSNIPKTTQVFIEDIGCWINEIQPHLWKKVMENLNKSGKLFHTSTYTVYFMNQNLCFSSKLLLARILGNPQRTWPNITQVFT